MSGQPQKKVKSCRLVGCNSNAFALMGRWAACARREGWTEQEIDDALTTVMSGDYQHLLRALANLCEDPTAPDED